jgi:predicted SAM-dependent methyltransferase
MEARLEQQVTNNPLCTTVKEDPKVPCPCGSDLEFLACHGKPNTPILTPKLELAKPTTELKLDLAAGQSPREGFEGVDIWSGAKHVVDLWKFPWPFEDESVSELHCSHHAEHIPPRDVEERDIRADPTVSKDTYHQFLGKDMFFAFFDECYRILKPEGWMTVIVPALRSNRAFQDPTHRRFIPAETFLYLSAEWRKGNKLDHYRAQCNFACDVNPTIYSELALRSPEVQGRMMNENWNCVFDFHAKLKKLPPPA